MTATACPSCVSDHESPEGEPNTRTCTTVSVYAVAGSPKPKEPSVDSVMRTSEVALGEGRGAFVAEAEAMGLGVAVGTAVGSCGRMAVGVAVAEGGVADGEDAGTAVGSSGTRGEAVGSGVGVGGGVAWRDCAS